LKVLDLFCGNGGFSQAFKGHDITGIDLKKCKEFQGKFIQANLEDYIPEDYYDVILASPPCTEFSIAKKIGWGNQNEMKGLDLVYRAFNIIQTLKPKWYCVENVSGLNKILYPCNYKIHKKNKKRWCLWTNITIGFFDYDYTWSHADKKHRDKIPYAISHAIHKGIIDKKGEGNLM